MPPRLLLDGEDLRALMLRVRDEMGPDARIVKAERVRTGGVGGFFARERYELTVEVPDRPADRRRPAPRRQAPSAPAPAAPGGTPAPAERSEVGLDALLAAAEAEERRALDEDDAAPTVSTDGETFAEVLDSVRRMVEPEGFVPATPPSVTGGSGSAERTPTDAPPADGAPSGDRAPVVVDGDAAGTGYTAGTADPDAPAVDESDGGDDARPGSTAAGLLELGIPARLLAGVTDLRAEVPVSVLVRRFGRPPAVRLTKGNVVAVVGDGPAALRVATQMAHRAGLAERDIVLAGHIDSVPGHGRRLQSTAALAKFRAKASPEALYLVVVGVGPEPDGPAEAAEMLAAIEPTQTWAVLDARRRTSELRRRLRGLAAARPIDALAVHSTAEAQAPGLVLGLGLPVGWVDGLPANPLVWAALLSERLADDARWD